MAAPELRVGVPFTRLARSAFAAALAAGCGDDAVLMRRALEGVGPRSGR